MIKHDSGKPGQSLLHSSAALTCTLTSQKVNEATSARSAWLCSRQEVRSIHHSTVEQVGHDLDHLRQ